MEERGRTAGYDPSVDSCLGRPGIRGAGMSGRRHPRTPRPASAVCSLPVTEDLLSLLAELQEAVQAGAEGSSLGLVSDWPPHPGMLLVTRCSVSPTVTVLLLYRLRPQMCADMYSIRKVSCEEGVPAAKVGPALVEAGSSGSSHTGRVK